MTYILEELRDADNDRDRTATLYKDAADEIERLQLYKRAQIEDIINLGHQVGELEVENKRLRAEVAVVKDLLKEWVELDNRGSASNKLIDISRIMLGMENGRP